MPSLLDTLNPAHSAWDPSKIETRLFIGGKWVLRCVWSVMNEMARPRSHVQ
jgi:hypothetical protein